MKVYPKKSIRGSAEKQLYSERTQLANEQNLDPKTSISRTKSGMILGRRITKEEHGSSASPLADTLGGIKFLRCQL